MASDIRKEGIMSSRHIVHTTIKHHIKKRKKKTLHNKSYTDKLQQL